MSDFLMPSLGADMEEATIVEWLKDVGDRVKRGDVLAVVETVKGAIEIEAFEDGILESIDAAPGSVVAVGEVLARLKEGTTEAAGKQAGTLAEAPPPTSPQTPTAAAASPSPGGPTRVSPAARKRATELGIAIETVPAGPHGVVGLSDVEAASTPAKSKTRPSMAKGKSGLDFVAMRKAIGAAMARSKREIPHYYVASTIDMSAFLEWLTKANAEKSVADRMLYAAPLLKAVAMAVKRVPALNGFYADDEHKPSEQVHLGLATAMRGGGLIAPAIHDADTLTTFDAMAQLRDVVDRVRSGRLRGSEMTDATITLSILGEGTADSLQPVIYPPQVAIVGCGAIRESPWIVNNTIVAAKVMTVTVAGDHRVSDGRAAARFLGHLDEILQEPETL